MKRIALLFLIGTLLAIGGIILAKHQINQASDKNVFTSLDDIPAQKVALVLGCSRTLPNGLNNLYFQYRIQAAADLFSAGKAEYILVSGDNSRVGYDEPTDMFNALINAGIPADRIVKDYAGFSTLDSIVRTQKVFLENRFIVVSQEFHIRRAIYIGKTKGLDITGFAARDVSGVHSVRTLLREQLACVKTVLDVVLLRRKPHFLGEPIPIQTGA
ncbi:MAG: ElyC/SanA/YdcF family protein [Kiritimatiellales bacterium]|nr:ElyC/SanA/YdcF family protein [Kiritimatiellales bacterium]